MKRNLTDQLANLILGGKIEAGSRVKIDAGEDGLVFETTKVGKAATR
jgi:hypothetical protein